MELDFASVEQVISCPHTVPDNAFITDHLGDADFGMWEEGFHLCLVMTCQQSTVMDCITGVMVTSFMEMIPIPT